MKKQHGVFNTDRVNRHNARIPAAELLRGTERHFKESIKMGVPLGSPTCISHDLHRLAGWNRTCGFYLDRRVTHQLGVMFAPETDAERQQLHDVYKLYLRANDQKHTSSYEPGLRKRIGDVSCGQVVGTSGGAAIFSKGVAKIVASELFPAVANDRDGLTEYKRLLEVCDQIHPGVFRHKTKNVLLYAHAFFRRSLSIRNNLNDYFLGNLRDFAHTHPEVVIRLRLDEDIVGSPESFLHPIELEYWYGPKFSSDISRIPSGVTVHAASARESFYEGIQTTHFWWKGVEERREGSGPRKEYRTFEAEELIEHPSPGLDSQAYGCRYVHSEYSDDLKHITHFDGAIRAYGADQYQARLEKNIDRSGKHSAYTKLFRCDGPIAVEDWKLLLTNFFRGNNLVPEYLGAETSFEHPDVPANPHDDASPVQEHELLAYIGYELPSADALRAPLDLDTLIVKKTAMRCFEAPVRNESKLRTYIESKIGSGNACILDYGDGVINCPIFTVDTGDERTRFSVIVEEIKHALDKDIAQGLITAVAISFAWNWDDFLIKLSFSGGAENVSSLLAEIPPCTDLTVAPSMWVESLKEITDRYQSMAQPSGEPWAYVSDRNILQMRHANETATVAFPQSWATSLTVDSEGIEPEPPPSGPEDEHP